MYFRRIETKGTQPLNLHYLTSIMAAIVHVGIGLVKYKMVIELRGGYGTSLCRNEYNAAKDHSIDRTGD